MRQRESVLGHVRVSRERPEDDLVEIRLERPAPVGAVLEETRVQVQLPSGGRPEALGVIVEAADSLLVVRADDDSSVPLPLTAGSRILLDTRQEAASLSRQIAALNALEDRADVCGDLADLVVFPERLKDAVPIKIVPRTANLDGSNRTVVEHALGTERIFLIQGPPGTGKTTVITELIAQILERERQSRVLLVSQANVAVDNVLERLDDLLPATNAVRLGRSDKVAAAVQHMLLDSKLREEAEAVRVRAAQASELLDALPSRQESIEALQELWTLAVGQTSDRIEVRRMASEVLGTAAGVSDDDLPDRIAAARDLAGGTAEWHAARRQLQADWRERLSRAGELETLLFANMRVVAGTCIGVISNRTIAEHKFDWVIVDEAARAAAPELLVPLIRGARIVLVGDHRQLPPILDREVIDEVFERGLATREQFERSLFETLFNGAPEGARARLTKQYRMHPTIAGLIEHCFYPAGLGNGITASDRPLGIEVWGAPLRWLDTSQLDAQERRVGTSYSNPEEVQIIVHDLKRVIAVASEKGLPPLRVGVLSGYARQVDLLADDIGRLKLSADVQIDTMSVDAAQGKEYDLVYYSAVRANRNGRIGFLHDERRLNVALSRARHGLTIVGHRQSLREADTRYGPNPFLSISRYLAQAKDASVLNVGRR
ncbi:MAG: AAA family ATPase [Gemmatimonadaceae bacterium]|nr:AAA family ATPase [Gemmatimonadaceae bacterium]